MFRLFRVFSAFSDLLLVTFEVVLMGLMYHCFQGLSGRTCRLFC